MKVVVDVMGSDKGPAEIILGAVKAIDNLNIPVILSGDEKTIKDILDKKNYNRKKIEILHAEDVILMNESPLVALRQKKKSSISVGLEAVKKGDADCFVSPGNTGAVAACATLKLRLIKGIERAGIAAFFPNMKDGMTNIIDVGANVDCKPKHLLHYAIMGSVMYREIIGIDKCSVGLLNVGEEDVKGNELSKASFELLKNNIAGFSGNIEGNDIYNGSTNVVVCDGFTGNVVLKSSEQLAKMFFHLVKNKVSEKLQYKIGALMLKNAFKDLKKITSASQYGGAQLLGINGYCVIGHGSSSSTAIMNAIRIGKKIYDKKVTEQIEKKISNIKIKKGE